MSPAGFSIAWTDYMTLVTEKLNALTAGASPLKLRGTLGPKWQGKKGVS
jgi:hypothetical protein